MSQQRHRLMVVGAAAALVLVAACGSSSSSTSSSSQSSDTASAAGSAAAGSAAASPSSSAPSSTDALYAQAKQEGSVIWYSADVPAAGAAVNAAFEKKYPGIKVTLVRLASTDLLARYTSEKKAGAPTADVIEQTDISFSNNGQANNLTQSFSSAGIPGYSEIPKNWQMTSGDPFALTVWVLAYNTQLVTAADSPKTLQDILDPKWKGKLVAPDPAQSTGYAVGWGTAADHFGNDYLTKLHDQDVTWEATGSAGSEAALVSGEKSVNLVGSISTLQADKAKGAPIAWNVPPISTGSAYIYSLNNKPSHPAAAKLFASFVISKEGNQAEFSQNPASGSTWLQPKGTQILTLVTKYAEPAAAAAIVTTLTGKAPAS